MQLSDARVKVTHITSPMLLLFGAVESPIRPFESNHGGWPTRSQLLTDSSVFEVAILDCEMSSTYYKY